MNRLTVRNPDTGKTIALVALVGAVGYGLYKLIVPEKEGVPSGLTITSYQNLRTGVTVVTPNVLDVEIRDTIRVNFKYDYFGPAIGGTYHIAIWKRNLDPHGEFVTKDVDFTLSATPEKKTISVFADLVCESWQMTPDMYGLYIKIMSIPGADIFSPYYPEILKVGIVEEEGWFPGHTELARADFLVSIVESEWKLANTELASKGFTVSIVETEWKPGHTELARQSFSVNITEAPIEYYVVKVAADPVWGGWVVQEPDKNKYAYGEIVKLTANPFWGFDFLYWDFNGEWLDNYSPINLLVTRDGTVTAHFRF